MTKRTDGILCATRKGYIVDGIGNVWYRGRIVNGYVDNKGYRRIKIRDEGNRSIDVLVHRLHAYQKYGDEIFREGIQIRHLNGVKSDNSWINIGIGTQSENMMDRPEDKRREIAMLASSYISKIVIAGGIEFPSYLAAGRYFGISDNGIRKRIKLNWPGYKALDS